ncbi:hypothetical protein Prudu_000599, partial [Prunus dulcis]
AVRPFAFSATARPPQAEPISAVGTIGSASVSPSQPDQPPPQGRLSWPETMFSGGGSFEATRTSSSKFSFVSPPNRSSKASEVQPTSRRNLQRAVEVCGIHHRAIHSFRASKPGETLPNFRQKSKEILKRN